jgi:hypothetical protein
LFPAVPHLVRRWKLPAAGALGAALALAGLYAAAAGSDRTVIEQILRNLEASPKHQVTADALHSARQALERADGARRSGDTRHPPLLEALARQWTEMARDLVRTADTERESAELEKQAAELETKVVRAHALVEETMARQHRALQKLKELESGPAPTSPAPSPPSKRAPVRAVDAGAQ